MGQRDALQNRPLGGSQRNPHLLQGGGGADVGQVFWPTSSYVGQLAVEGPDHIGNADGFGWPCQSVAAFWATLAAQ